MFVKKFNYIDSNTLIALPIFARIGFFQGPNNSSGHVFNGPSANGCDSTKFNFNTSAKGFLNFLPEPRLLRAVTSFKYTTDD